MADPGRRRAARRKVGAFGYGDLTSSLILVFPLFIAYGVGVMFSDTVNGVDFVTRWLLAAVGYDRTNYLIAHLALLGAFLLFVAYMRHRHGFSLRGASPMVLESGIYALTLGTLIVFVMQNLLGFAVPGSAVSSLGKVGNVLVTSAGAGVHEELVFRLGLMAGITAALMALGVARGLAVFIALSISSALFSAAHHIGPLGDDWEIGVFTYRALAGVAFGMIFYFRSLSHAVYTHFLYDVYVLLLRS